MENWIILGGTGLLLLILILNFFIVGLLVVYDMAKKRGRNAGGWTCFAFLMGILPVVLFLIGLGETSEQEDYRIYQEEIIREKARKGESFD